MTGLTALLLGALSLSSGVDDVGPVSLAERAALEKLYASTDGDHWCNHDGWLGERGTECQWYGVSCGFAHSESELRWSVNSLDLWDNNLRGALPSEIDQLPSLEYLHLAGNSIVGPVPRGVLGRWLSGELIFQGYGEIVGTWMIQIQYRTVVLCTDFEATLSSDGSALLTSERCAGEPRMKYEGSDGLDVYCETQKGHTDRFGDAFGHLAWLLEEQGFDRLERTYSRSITHGGDLSVSVWSRGGRKTVLDYADSAPINLWVIEQAIQGVVRGALWESSERSPQCSWTEFDALP
ncbi:MAG TPA: hypothetical protein VMN82_05135 [Thermoanaerobaculia bacterium]|nr:hypothetical protein [Thermoanaerobaculia bacterium]